MTYVVCDHTRDTIISFASWDDNTYLSIGVAWSGKEISSNFAVVNQKPKVMISSTQLEAFYERYQREGVPNDLSMQAFCSMHNVPYNCFERHVKQRAKFKNIKTVSITGLPESEQPESAADKESVVERDVTPVLLTDTGEKVRILVTIKMSNGFQIHRSNIDYRTLLGLVEKMEALC